MEVYKRILLIYSNFIYFLSVKIHAGCIKFLIPYFSEEYLVIKKGREYHGFGKKIKERGSNIIFSLILRLLGRKIKERGSTYHLSFNIEAVGKKNKVGKGTKILDLKIKKRG